MLADSPPPPCPGECQNCGTRFEGNFCPHCGQEAHIEIPTAFEFLHEFFGHYVALESKLFRTLKILFLAPGQLTLDYLEGRRRSRVLPLRLYLSCSVLFFLVLTVSGNFSDSLSLQREGDSAPVGNVKTVVPKSNGAKPLVLVGDPGVANKIAGAVTTAKAKAGSAGQAGHTLTVQAEDESDLKNLTSDGKHHVAAVIDVDGKKISADKVFERVRHYAPHAMFVLVPCFAALLALYFRKRRQRYGAHLLFALHFHAFAFLWLLPTLFIPPRPWEWLDTVASYWPWGILLYLVLALRRVYGGRWKAAILRTLALSVSYALIALLTLLGGVVLAALV